MKSEDNAVMYTPKVALDRTDPITNAYVKESRLILNILGEKLSDHNIEQCAAYLNKIKTIEELNNLTDKERRQILKGVKKELNKTKIAFNKSANCDFGRGYVEGKVNLSTDKTTGQLPSAFEKGLKPLDLAYNQKENGTFKVGSEWEGMLKEIVDRMKQGFHLERPQGTSIHHLLDYLNQKDTKGQFGWMMKMMESEVKSFVIEHDWAKAFEGVTDFNGGEIKLPYDYNCFEFRINGMRILVVLGNSTEPHPVGFLTTGIHGHWFVNANRIKFVDGELVLGRESGFAMDQPVIKEWLKELSKQIRAVCIMLDAGVAVGETRSTGGQGLNKKRLAQGKAPLPDYRVVTLAKRLRGHYEGSGDPTGIKKRLHWRRGHWRYFSTPGGKEKFIDQEGITRSRTWINWQLVGDEQLGFVDKHYRL